VDIINFLQWMGRMRPVSYYVLSRGVLLCCALLAAELVVLVWAGEYAYSNVRLHFYAQQFQDMALTVLGAGLIGSALLEDVLIHNP